MIILVVNKTGDERNDYLSLENILTFILMREYTMLGAWKYFVKKLGKHENL